MKKYFFIFAFIISFFLLDSKVLADDAGFLAPDGNTYQHKYTSSTYWRANVYTNNKCCFVSSDYLDYNGGRYYYLFTIGTSENQDYLCLISSQAYSNSPSVSTRYPQVGATASVSDTVLYNSSDQIFTTNSSFGFDSNAYDLPIFDNYEDAFNYLTTPDIDFDNVYYNPIIPLPNFSIKNYVHLNDYSIDYSMLVSDQSMSIDDHPLYLMSMIYFYVPETVRVGYDSFTPYNFKKSSPVYIADYSDLELVNYQSYDLDNRFHSDYQEFYEYWANNRNFAGTDGMDAGYLLQRTTQYVDYAAEGIPYMGNGLEVWMRYFYVDDGIIYAGDWKKWNSYRYRDYEKVVAEEEGYPSKGISQTINENDPNTEGDTYDPIGVQTGNVTQTVNVNTNVPNYPDYPTINSFNKDNALVQVIDATSYMADPNNGFFGQFGGFLSAIFGFIPDSVWFIIGTGFSVSIFVMFLKIL